MPGAEPDPSFPRHPRAPLVDTALVAGCAAVGVLLALAANAGPDARSGVAFAADLGFGLLACVALWWRRDQPVAVGLLTAACDVVSFAGTPAYLVAVFALAVRRPPLVVVLVALAHLGAVAVGSTIDSAHDDPLWQVVVVSALFLGLVVASGLYAGARRDLVASLRERAARLEADRERDLADARTAERTRIAGEVHDVLAHRISLISLHAGGLQVTAQSGEADPRTVEAAALIGATARSAMGDLRDVIGLLRDDDPGSTAGRDAPAPPQPTLDAVPDLVQSSRRAGLPVDLELDVAGDDVRACPASAGRHVYRVVQESLTNVHKHTARAATTVRVSGAPGASLAVEVSNALPPDGEVEAMPGSGSGLVGLHERITRAGGEFTSGPVGGRFVVRAVLSWP